MTYCSQVRLGALLVPSLLLSVCVCPVVGILCFCLSSEILVHSPHEFFIEADTVLTAYLVNSESLE